MKYFINANLITTFLNFYMKATFILVLMYIAILAINTNEYKKGRISKKEFLRYTMLDKMIEFKKNYRTKIYIFITNTIYNFAKNKKLL